MDTLEYLKAKNRMTNNCKVMCKECKLGSYKNGKTVTCGELEGIYPKQAIQIVEDWAKENPIVTNIDKFDEVIKKTFGIEEIKSRCNINLPTIMCYDFNCDECKEFWNSEYRAPVKESKTNE